MTLGEKIQELRRRCGMSQDALAEKLEVSRQAVSKWERDEAIPETEKIVRLAQEFGVSTDYLLLNLEEKAKSVPASPEPKAEPTAGQQILRGVRRHGYKAGYGMLAWGGILCAIALLVLLLLPRLGSDVSGIFDGFQSAAQNMAANSGVGSFENMVDGMLGSFGQQVDQMEHQRTGTIRILAWFFSGPLLLMGAGLMIGGLVVIVKGKKIAKMQA